MVAENDDTVLVEGNHYFPPHAVPPGMLEPNDTHTVCPWKGTASHYNLVVNGQRNPDAVWFYPTPKPAAKEIAGRVAFWKGMIVKP